MFISIQIFSTSLDSTVLTCLTRSHKCFWDLHKRLHADQPETFSPETRNRNQTQESQPSVGHFETRGDESALSFSNMKLHLLVELQKRPSVAALMLSDPRFNPHDGQQSTSRSDITFPEGRSETVE